MAISGGDSSVVEAGAHGRTALNKRGYSSAARVQHGETAVSARGYNSKRGLHSGIYSQDRRVAKSSRQKNWVRRDEQISLYPRLFKNCVPDVWVI